MEKPLAFKMMPESLDEYVGQEHILSKDKMLYRLIESDKLSSIILWGPPGCGKTSLAKVIANTTKNKYVQLNAVTAGVGDIKKLIEETQNAMLNPSGRVVLFLDEIHRFNKLQQDALLPFVENGTIILIGATTENPYFEVNKALLSRSTVFKLELLKSEDIVKIINNCLKSEKGLGNISIKISDENKKYLAEISCGDVRTALTGLEIAVSTTKMQKDGTIIITREVIDECVQKKIIQFDKNGDSHYDNISAMIKSMRGSDPDAVLFYLARAIQGGEDPMFLARRITICAAEDVGLANPQALVVANSAMQAVHMIGMPESRIILAEAAVYVAKSAKSNSVYLGIDRALADVATGDTGTIPMHIRNAVVEGMGEHGYGVGYRYPHDYPQHRVEQQYLPDKVKDRKYYVKDETEQDI